MDVDLEKYNSIDEAWRLQARQRFFGEATRPIQRLTIPLAQLVKAHEFGMYVDTLSKVRDEQLRSDTYLSAEEAYAEISIATGVLLAPADIDMLRESGTLLGIPDHGIWLYPHFQFDRESSMPSPLIKDVSRLLNKSSEWEQLSWWHLPRTGLGGGSFADNIHTEKGIAAIHKGIEALI